MQSPVRPTSPRRDVRSTSDVTVEAPRITDLELLIAASAIGCPVIDDGRPCDLQYGHRGRHWSGSHR